MAQVKIRVKGILDEHWSGWFGDLMIAYSERGETILTGPVPDRNAFFGLVARLRDAGLPIRSIDWAEQDAEPGEAAG